MPACLSAVQIARYQRAGCLPRADCLMPDEVRHHRGYLEAFKRVRGFDSNNLLTVRRRSGDAGI